MGGRRQVNRAGGRRRVNRLDGCRWVNREGELVKQSGERVGRQTGEQTGKLGAVDDLQSVSRQQGIDKLGVPDDSDALGGRPKLGAGLHAG